MRAFPSPLLQQDDVEEIPTIQGNRITLPYIPTRTPISTPTNSSPIIRPSAYPEEALEHEAQGRRVHQIVLKHPLQSSDPTTHPRPEPHLQAFNQQGYPVSGLGSSVPAAYPPSPRRGSQPPPPPSLQQLQEHQTQQQQQQHSLQQQQDHYRLHQVYQHQQQQFWDRFGSGPSDPPYHLYSSQPANLSEHRPLSDFVAPSSLPVGQGSNPNEGAAMTGMPSGTFPPPGQGQQLTQNPATNALNPYSFHRSYDRSGDHSEMSSMSGSTSDWSSMPNLRLLQQLRGLQGDLASATTSNLASSPEERGKGGHQSRARLQKHLRDLQAEMVDLKERVRMAEHLYQDSSSNEMSSARSQLLGDGSGRGPYEDFKGEERRSGGDVMNLGQGPSASSALTTPNTSTSTAPTSSGRRGTWRTEGGGKVLVFNTAGSSETEPRPLDERRDGASSGQVDAMDEGGGEESDAGDDANKRYECLVPGCQKTFTTSGHARRHSRTHLGHKLFICPHEGCRSTFTRRDNCRQHQRARHHMTLPVRESTETETLESLIVDRQASQQQQPSHQQHQQQLPPPQQPHYAYDTGSSSSSSYQNRRPPFG